MQDLLKRVDVFINVGANIGYYCCWALKAGKHVVAFEPVEMNLRCLLRNVTANGWESNIEVFPLALTNACGIVRLYGANGGGRTTGSLLKGWAGAAEKDVMFAPASTLDTVLGSRFAGRQCLVLADIEGAEKSISRGRGVF